MNRGDHHLGHDGGAPVRAEHVGCGADVRLVPVCTAGHRPASPEEVRIIPGPGARPRT